MLVRRQRVCTFGRRPARGPRLGSSAGPIRGGFAAPAPARRSPSRSPPQTAAHPSRSGHGVWLRPQAAVRGRLVRSGLANLLRLFRVILDVMRRLCALGAAALGATAILVGLVLPASAATTGTPCGVVTGKSVPCTNHPIARLYVFQHGVQVATGRFRVSKPFRFVLTPGRYAITQVVNPRFATPLVVKAGRTTTVAVKDLCY